MCLELHAPQGLMESHRSQIRRMKITLPIHKQMIIVNGFRPPPLQPQFETHTKPD